MKTKLVECLTKRQFDLERERFFARIARVNKPRFSRGMLMEDLGKAPPTIKRALADADAWNEACQAGLPIPNWALSLRVLAGALRRQKLIIEKRAAT